MRNLEWDYTQLAADYDHRPDYEPAVIRRALAACGLVTGDAVLDVGAGTGKLTALLCAENLRVTACEPNPAMRAVASRKPALRGAHWTAARGESLPFRSGSMRAVTYGSSFNVLQPEAALSECARVLAPRGHWLAVWNHRDLTDPLQAAVEQAIRRHLPSYDPGSRRNAPEAAVRVHPAFTDLRAMEGRMTVRVEASNWLQAWHAHATLRRQAGDRMPPILQDLRALVGGADTLDVPYCTRAWLARKVA